MRKTVKECKTIDASEVFGIEALIDQLKTIRRLNNQDITIRFGGGNGFGYRIYCEWERPMTELEIARLEELHRKAEEAEKEVRRAQFEKLRAEFEPKDEAA